MCTYMCVWIALFLVSNNHPELQIESIWTPNRRNLDSSISSWDSGSPRRVPEFPGIIKSDFPFNFLSILDTSSPPFWVQEHSFSSVFRMGVSARAPRVFRLAQQAQKKDYAEAKSGFGMVNNRSNSMTTLLATKCINGQLWTLQGSFFASISTCFELQDPP